MIEQKEFGLFLIIVGIVWTALLRYYMYYDNKQKGE